MFELVNPKHETEGLSIDDSQFNFLACFVVRKLYVLIGHRILMIECKYDFNTWRANEILSTQFYIKQDFLEKRAL